MVVNNIDPMQIGRIQAMVPDVSAMLPTTWAMPCVPIAGKQMGTYVVPQIGAGVWIEFEQGDPDFPVWVGGFWGIVARCPLWLCAGHPVSPSIVLQPPAQNCIVISDLPGPTGGMYSSAPRAAMMMVNDIGVSIQNGKGASITLVGPTVTINMGALVVI